MGIISGKQQTRGLMELIVLILCLLFFMAWSPHPAWGGAELPPRHLPTPSPTPPAGSRGVEKDERVGAYIELHVSPALGDAWTVVQWQDTVGSWHDVDGWQGTLEGGFSKQWWVAEKDFGTGPFRWTVTEGAGGRLLAVSGSFTLPTEPNELLQLEASLDR